MLFPTAIFGSMPRPCRDAQLRRAFGVVTLGVALGVACSGSRVQLGLVEASSVDLSNSIEYRALTRADFQSSKPMKANPEGYELHAHTCAVLMTTPDTFMTSVSRPTPGGEPAFGVTFKALGFRALMNRDCSWWNEKGTMDAAYVLEHEQIHFALTELGARRLNANATQIARDLERETLAASPTGAVEGAQAALNGVLLQQSALDQARNDAFDSETSFGYNPERQKVWLGQVNSELVATAAWASGARAHYRR